MLSNGKVLTIITELVWRGTSDFFIPKTESGSAAARKYFLNPFNLREREVGEEDFWD